MDHRNKVTQSMEKIMISSKNLQSFKYAGKTYTEWKNAIMSDDDVTVSAILEKCHKSEKRLLLDPNVGPVSFRLMNDITLCCGTLTVQRANEFEIDCPWILACCYGAVKVLQVLYLHKVDVLYKDRQGDNCLHSMVKICSLRSDFEQKMTLTYSVLLDLLTFEELRTLLMQENKRTLRPLEEAIFHETFELYNAMFQTKDIYMVKEINVGINTVQYFDVTEYESGTREKRSPLLFLSLVTHNHVDRTSTSDIMLSDPMKSWFMAKKRSFFPIIILWMLFRLGYMTLYFYSIHLLFDIQSHDLNKTMLVHQNISSVNVQLYTTFDLWTTSITLGLSCWIVLLDITEVFARLMRRRPWYLGMFRVKDGTIVQYTFYRVVQLSQAYLTLILTICVLSVWFIGPGVMAHLNMSALQIFYAIMVALCMWSIMFFLQLLPELGHCVVAVQRMLGDLSRFFVIYCFFMTPYVVAFYQALSNSQITAFSTVTDAIYATFITMLNMISYLEARNTPIMVAVFTIHFFYVFIISVLLINFLIAMFSSSYAEVTQNREVIFVVQSLSVCKMLEERLFGPLKYLIRRFLQRKQFVYENGKYYITKVSVTIPENPACQI